MSINNDAKSWIVLIVDDERDNLDIAAKVLKFHGAQVHTAGDGEDGLEILKQITPTFVLLDLSMPRVDGWGMLKVIRETPATRQIPVIALTAHAMEGDKQRVMNAGFNGYISKPYRLASFLSEIQHWLELAPAAH
jgi:two-component system cell cycle response regulator DivK